MDEKEKKIKETENTFMFKVGKILAVVFVSCVAACIASACVAATIKFVQWILF